MRELRRKLHEQTMQLIEITNEYTSFRSKSQIDRAELESLLEQEKLKVAQGLQTEEL